MHEFGFLRKLPFCSLMKIKSGLWYASTDGSKRPLHICAEIKWSSSTELEKSAVFKEKRGEERLWFSPNSVSSTMPALDGPDHSSYSETSQQVGSLWPPNWCHLHFAHWPVKQRPTSGLLWSVFTQAGLGKKRYPLSSWEGTGLGSVTISSQYWGRWMAWTVRLLWWPVHGG